MSLSVKKLIHFPQGGLEYNPPVTNGIVSDNSLELLGSVLRDTRYVWQAKGPVLEIRNTKTGSKVGAWVFGGILKDSNTKIVCVEEILRPNGRISLLAVGIECSITGGIICIFDIFSSKVIRAIHLKEKLSSLHTIDSGIEDLNLPGPLRNFDGILAAGTEGGEVILIDICRQICEEALHSTSKRDELNPAQLVILTSKHIPRIEHYKERSVRDGNHLAIHLNVVVDSTTEHFVLKGPKGDDRIHVNREEVITSALYFCPQLTSLLVGYNFGAFQLWNLTTLSLVYTSPVCDDHFPITNFALQEPTDDPRAFCYVWVAYGNTELFQTGLPFAVMYSFSYESKEYQEGYGYLYQDFHYCTIRFQVELGQLEEHRNGIQPKGGYCLGFQPITKLCINKESFSHSSAGDTLALCLISWTIWFSKSETQTCCLLFDLNQWYKEQMPNFTKWKDSTNYILKANLNELIHLNGHKGAPISNILIENSSISQFIGIQRLEEHFYPSSLSFNMWILRESDIVLLHNQGLQKYLLSQIESAGPLCLLRPTEICKQALSIGLMPLFIDIHPNRALSTDTQKEIVLDIALEHHLIGWLCKCASEWANGSFSSAGCSLDLIITWAFQRAIVLKTNCDKYCTPLFDYSQSRLDNNTSILLNSCTRQINSLCVLYKHIVNKLWSYIGCLDLVKEQCTGLEMVSVYFEVLQWLVNVGLLPECHPSTYPRPDNSERISAPYPVQELCEYYNEKRAELRLLAKETFDSTDSLLFIDNLIEKKCGGGRLQKQWQEDGGSGLYPPPSLQSLIRTYLVDGAGISHKHSLVIYLFLDLAMALDQSRYASVVTHLIKFPAVFKVSPSIIKITQAFWQLDHGDFTTAMEQLLDPFVLGEDLQPWHHTIAMRSLLIHKQPNFALLYMQIRKPPITDEKDILTAISLFIANSMLDEAFYFKKQLQNNNEEKLLTHLFRECSKTDALHLVLYKCLNTDEEKAFFKYLKSVENPTSDDLQIFYYLLRSRFIEAFDTHSNIKRKHPDRQGLIGQSMASNTDQIVKIFKTLLPNVNKNLVDYIRKERTNLWKEVQRPTPMSVFVHDTNEQVKYKSTMIHAALAKAKRTFSDFSDSFNQSCRNLVTEETPFLRTPTIFKNCKRAITPVITPKIIDMNQSVCEDSAPPNKRMKISPRAAASTPQSPIKNMSQSLVSTPIVKRKTSLLHDQSLTYSNMNVCTPQSILKVRHLVQQRDSINDETIPDEEHDNRARENSIQNTSLRLQPRSSLSRTPKRQHVQFDEATRFSSSLSELSSKLLDTTPLSDRTPHKSSLSSKDISSMMSSTTNEDISDDVFYSPDNSGKEEEGDKVEQEPEQPKEKETVENKQVRKTIELEFKEEEKVTTIEGTKVEKKKDVLINQETEKPVIPSKIEGILGSPKARRSYKRSLREMSPTRSSPRLSRQIANQQETISQNQSGTGDSNSEKHTTSNDSMSTDSLSPKPTRIVPKIKGRKSLSRQVLENNTFSKILSPAPKDSVVSKEIYYSKTEKTSVTEKSLDESKVTTVESNLEIVDTIEKDSDRKTPVTRKSHISSSAVKKQQQLEKTIDTDTSVDSELSYQCEEQESSMKLSDSLQEYIDFLMSSGKKISDRENLQSMEESRQDSDEEMVAENKTDAQNQESSSDESIIETATEPEVEISQEPKQNEEDPLGIARDIFDEINEEKEEDPMEIARHIIFDGIEDNENEIDIVQRAVMDGIEDDTEESIEILATADQILLKEIEEQEKYQKRFENITRRREIKSNPIVQHKFSNFDNLDPERRRSKGLLSSSMVLSEIAALQKERESRAANRASKRTSVLSTGTDERQQESSFNEFEANIFDIAGGEEASSSKNKRSSRLTGAYTSDIYDLPASEVAFLEDPNASDDVVVISSSEDECKSKHSSKSSYSRSSSNRSKSTEQSDTSEGENAPIIFQYEKQKQDDEESNNKNDTDDVFVKEDLENAEDVLDKEVAAICSEKTLDENLQYIVDVAINTSKLANDLMKDQASSASVEKDQGDSEGLDKLIIYIETPEESNTMENLVFTPFAIEEDNKNTDEKDVKSTVDQDPLVTPEEPKSFKNTDEKDVKSKSDQDLLVTLEEPKSSKNTDEKVVKSRADQDPLETPEEPKSLKNTDEKDVKSRANQDFLVTSEEPKSSTILPKEKPPKTDQSTNTTVFIKDKSSKTAIDKKAKIDQSKNTSEGDNDSMKVLNELKENVEDNNSAKDVITADVAETEQNMEDSFVDNIERPQPKNKYSRNKKATGGDKTTSSSDTTEGETFRNISVAVEVHTPSTPKKKPENTPSKRVTRKNSASMPPSADIDGISTVSDTEEVKNLVVEIERNVASKNFEEGKQPVVGKRSRRAYSASDTPAQINIGKPEIIDCDPNNSTEIIDDATMVKLTLRKKRSASTDAIKTFSRKKSAKKNEEVDDEFVESSSEKKAKSVTQMPIISEEKIGKENLKGNKKAKSVISSYSTSRRLTRRQANIVKEVTAATATLEDDLKKQIDLEHIDPIQLLDKEMFEGKPDPDENKVYELSSPSTSTVTSVQRTKRRSRSGSVISDISISPPQPDTTSKIGRSTRSQTKSPVPSGMSTRSRKQSETGSVVSDPSTPPKKSRRKSADEDIESPARSTRSRAGSVSSVKSSESTSKKATRARRIVSAKSELPEISEENVDSTSSSKNSKTEEKSRRRSKTFT